MKGLGGANITRRYNLSRNCKEIKTAKMLFSITQPYHGYESHDGQTDLKIERTRIQELAQELSQWLTRARACEHIKDWAATLEESETRFVIMVDEIFGYIMSMLYPNEISYTDMNKTLKELLEITIVAHPRLGQYSSVVKYATRALELFVYLDQDHALLHRGQAYARKSMFRKVRTDILRRKLELSRW